MDTEQQIGDIAQAYGADQVRTLVLPTGVFIHVETADGPESDFTGPDTETTLPLHQIGAVDRLVRDLSTGTADLAVSRVRLRQILAMPPHYGPLAVVLGHALLTVGFGLILYPAVNALPAYLVMGALGRSPAAARRPLADAVHRAARRRGLPGQPRDDHRRRPRARHRPDPAARAAAGQLPARCRADRRGHGAHQQPGDRGCLAAWSTGSLSCCCSRSGSSPP